MKREVSPPRTSLFSDSGVAGPRQIPRCVKIRQQPGQGRDDDTRAYRRSLAPDGAGGPGLQPSLAESAHRLVRGVRLLAHADDQLPRPRNHHALGTEHKGRPASDGLSDEPADGLRLHHVLRVPGSAGGALRRCRRPPHDHRRRHRAVEPGHRPVRAHPHLLAVLRGARRHRRRRILQWPRDLFDAVGPVSAGQAAARHRGDELRLHGGHRPVAHRRRRDRPVPAKHAADHAADRRNAEKLADWRSCWSGCPAWSSRPWCGPFPNRCAAAAR